MPTSGELISVLGMGTWITFDVGPSHRLRNARVSALQSFSDHGGAIVASSPMYSSSEEVVGYCLKQESRPDRLFSATTVWTPIDAHEVEQMETSEWLGDEMPFDLLQVHNPLNWETHLETLKSWKVAKQVRYIGITTSQGRPHDDFAELTRTQSLDFAQFTHNILDREAEDRFLPLAVNQGIAAVVKRPFQRGGRLEHVAAHPLPDWAAEFGTETRAQFFLKFVLSHPAATCAIPATSQVNHMVKIWRRPGTRCRTRRRAGASSIKSSGFEAMVPYPAEVFFDLLATYNSGIWPGQIDGALLERLVVRTASVSTPSRRLNYRRFPRLRLGMDRARVPHESSRHPELGWNQFRNDLRRAGRVVSIFGNNPKPATVPRQQEYRFSAGSELVGTRLDYRPGRQSCAKTNGYPHLQNIAVMHRPSADPSFRNPRRLVQRGWRHGLDARHLLGLVPPCHRPHHDVLFHFPTPA